MLYSQFGLYYNLPFLHFKVNNASTLLNDYNERLQQELKDRHKVGKMIKDFLAAQKDLLAQAEERLEIYRDKLDKVNTIKDDLKSHIQSLPDLTQLPDYHIENLVILPDCYREGESSADVLTLPQ